MIMKKKILTTLSVVLILGLAALGILAYLMDTDDDVNVMTLGNVDIEQHEDFKDLADLYPGTEVKKEVTVENIGESDCYFRTLIAFEDIDSETFGINFPINEAYKWSWGAPEATIVIDGVTYQVYEALYQKALKPGETSPKSLTKVELAATSTNEDMEALGGKYEVLVLSQAVQTEGFADAKTALETAFGKTSEKAAEWFNGIVAYVEADGEKVEISGNEANEILEDLEAGKDLIVDENVDILAFETNKVDAQGATVTLDGQGPEAYGYLSVLPNAGEDATVSNLNVTGSGFVEVGHYGQGGGDYTLNNVKIENLAATLKNENKGFYLGCAFMGFGDTTLNNCVMTGTTAVQDGAIPVDLGCGQAWSGYTDGNDNKISTTINGGEYGTVYCWSHALVTINGAEIDTLYASPINGTVTINAGTEIDTLKVAYGTSAASDTRLAKLVVEDGANIGKIVFSDKNNTEKVFNTVAEWNAYIATF